MTDAAIYLFGPFRLDARDQRLWRGDEEIAVTPRYFNALLLMVRSPGQLVSKDRFFAEVWDGVIVGDEALTQCIAALRRALGDSPRQPAYILTVPKRGYRFVAAVDGDGSEPATARPHAPAAGLAGMVAAGTAGGAAAGALGGFYYLLGATGGPSGAAMSALIVLTLLNIVVGSLGAFGITLGMALESRILGRPRAFYLLGAAAGGLIVGTLFHLVATDGLHLLFGRAPGRFTGGFEGMVLGFALALGGRLGGGLDARRWRPALAAGLFSAVAGVLLALAGGMLMSGSLSNLAASFDRSQLDPALIAPLRALGVDGPAGAVVTAGLESLLFGLCVAAALLWWNQPTRRP